MITRFMQTIASVRNVLPLPGRLAAQACASPRFAALSLNQGYRRHERLTT